MEKINHRVIFLSRKNNIADRIYKTQSAVDFTEEALPSHGW